MIPLSLVGQHLIALVVTFNASGFEAHQRVEADGCWKEDTNEGMMILIE